MTFNLRYANARDVNSWSRRRPVTRALLAAEQPHLLGTQEGLHRQLKDIASDLGERYAYIGEGRQGGTRGEHVAIFYDVTRLSARDHEHFWLSDTPRVVGSNTWGAGAVRMVTLARMDDRVTGRSFYAVNTHLDHVSGDARQRGAAAIRERVTALRPELPVVVTGDFNAEAHSGSEVYQVLVEQAGYADAWAIAQRRSVAYATAHSYRAPVVDGPRIDWILTTPGVIVPAAAINTFQRDGQFPSDHFPVQARLRWPGQGDGA